MNLRKWVSKFGQIITVPSWSLDAGCADFYGCRLFVQLGPFIVMFWPYREAAE
jgi:hypothetical protein